MWLLRGDVPSGIVLFLYNGFLSFCVVLKVLKDNRYKGYGLVLKGLFHRLYSDPADSIEII